jgi:hypothetical protein
MSETNTTSQPILQFILSSSQIYYRRKILTFNREQVERMTKSLPPSWWNESDQIVYFSYHEDGTYFCEREKTIYDYLSKGHLKRVYEFNVLDNESAKEVFLIFGNFFEQVRIEELRLEKETLRKQIEEEFDYIEYDFISVRKMMLEGSDWTQLTDVFEKMSEIERNMWLKYRQYLRDITSLPEWKESNYINIFFPMEPNKLLVKYPQTTSEEYLTKSEHFNYYLSSVINTRIQKLLSSLALPSITDNVDIDESIDLNEDMSYDSYEALLTLINDKIQVIDPNLKVEIKVIDTSQG